MKELTFAFAAGTIALIIQITSLRFFFSSEYKPDLMLILVVWAGVRMPLTTGITFAFVIGTVVDALSGSPSGLFSLIYCVVFVLCNYVTVNFDMDTLGSRSVTLFLASLFGASVVMLLRLPGGTTGFGLIAAKWALVKAAITTSFSVPLVLAVNRLWDGYSRLIGLR